MEMKIEFVYFCIIGSSTKLYRIFTYSNDLW